MVKEIFLSFNALHLVLQDNFRIKKNIVVGDIYMLNFLISYTFAPPENCYVLYDKLLLTSLSLTRWECLKTLRYRG